jgi:preprotein translocase subunit SecA
VLNDQRKAVYQMRRRALGGEDIRGMVLDSLNNLIDDIMDECCQEGVHPEDWDMGGVKERLQRIFGLVWEDDADELRDHAAVELRGRMFDEVLELYEAKEAELGEGTLRQVERMLLLQFTDQLWKDHLLAMDRLRDGIGLRGYGQRNPLLEYKKEGFGMFQMMGAMRDEAVVSRIIRLQPNPELQAAAESGTKRQARQLARETSGAGVPLQSKEAPQAAGGGLRGLEAPTVDAEEAMRRLAERRQQAQAAAMLQAQEAKAKAEAERPAMGLEAKVFGERHGIKRNDPCPCGSGQKFKKCCMRAE